MAIGFLEIRSELQGSYQQLLLPHRRLLPLRRLRMRQMSQMLPTLDPRTKPSLLGRSKSRTPTTLHRNQQMSSLRHLWLLHWRYRGWHLNLLASTPSNLPLVQVRRQQQQQQPPPPPLWDHIRCSRRIRIQLPGEALLFSGRILAI